MNWTRNLPCYCYGCEEGPVLPIETAGRFRCPICGADVLEAREAARSRRRQTAD